MSQAKTFALDTNQLNQAGKLLLTYAQKHPEEFGIGPLTTVAGIANFVIPLVLGFTPAGPAAAAAATLQAVIGNLAAGTLFATLESMTLKGVLMTVGSVQIRVVEIVMEAGWASGIAWAKGVDWALGEHWQGWAQAVGIAGCEGWRRGVDLARSVDWGEVARGAAWAGNEAVQGAGWAAKEAAQGAGWAAKEAAQGAGWAGKEAVQGAGWAANEAVQGAGWAANEAVQGAGWAANEAVQGAGWAANEAVQGVQWVMKGWW